MDAAILIPVSIMRATGLEIGQQVDILEVDGHFEVHPVRVEVYDLDELVDAITPDNLHDVIDFGDAIGREVW
jgi:antitoxin MazE